MMIKLEPTNFHRKSSYQFENDNKKQISCRNSEILKNCQSKQFSNNEKNVNQCQFPTEFVMKKKQTWKTIHKIIGPSHQAILGKKQTKKTKLNH